MRFLYLLFFTTKLFAQTHYVVPDIRGRLTAETLTSKAPGHLPLWTNPALLGNVNTINLELASVGGEFNKEAETDIEERIDANGGYEITDLIDYSIKRPEEARTTFQVGALNFLLPYLSVSAFSSAELFSQEKTDSQNFKMGLTSRSGVIAGLAFSFGPLSLGYSYYLMKQGKYSLNPNDSAYTDLKNAADGDGVNADTINFSNFSNFSYGEGYGQNAGAFLSFSKKNDSGIGFSVLNIGDTKFKKDQNKLRGEFSKVGKAANEQADKLGLNINETDIIKEQANVGINLSSNRKSYLFASLAADYHDVFDKSLKNKLSASAELGFQIQKDLSLILSVPVKIDNTIYWIGLKKLSVYAAAREKDYYSWGWEAVLHVGIDKLWSLFEVYAHDLRTRSFNNKNFETKGNRFGVGLRMMVYSF